MDDSKIIISKLDNLSTKIDSIDTRVGNLETKFDNLETRFDGLETRFDNLETRFDGLETRFDGLESRVGNLESDVRDIKLTLENDISKAINVVIEGHMDLSRKLNEALKINEDRLTEHEAMKYKINHLDSEIVKINDKTRPLSKSSPAVQ